MIAGRMAGEPIRAREAFLAYLDAPPEGRTIDAMMGRLGPETGRAYQVARWADRQ